MKMDQRESDGAKQVNSVVINVKRWNEGRSFTIGASLEDKNAHMKGEQITAGQLTKL